MVRSPPSTGAGDDGAVRVGMAAAFIDVRVREPISRSTSMTGDEVEFTTPPTVDCAPAENTPTGRPRQIRWGR